MALVTMRYWAAAKDAAGVAEHQLTADTLAAALAAALEINGGARLSAVLNRSSFLIDGHPVGRRAADSVALADGNVIEVLPPFAGG
ncbi:MAG TPA: MoaD/ThiS family protein [Streptosporangiaceae bacterium]|nr:MoaD/ThiS family protein [Streptosporangiaceae bacterium]